jgi:predicted dehydrogenase
MPHTFQTWRHDLPRSGGGIFSDIIHLVYLAEALLDRRVERVSAYANAARWAPGWRTWSQAASRRPTAPR